MTAQSNTAAQYVRMSTDRQDLSPEVQKQAMAAFAQSNNLHITTSYEDGGKSGVDIANRPGLKALIRDVANNPPFKRVLVYDISRWGRFQDVDASAYYEYHCRLHGVDVIYVAEPFGADTAPMTNLAKNMKRCMAAEYSRELAFKSQAGQQRVVQMGFQMGALPPFGYRRVSVSADGKRHVLLEHGQRKISVTDRVQWVLGPDEEVALVRQICHAYATTQLDLSEIASIVNARGWRTEKGARLSARLIEKFLSNEVLIGNFVWGRTPPNRRRIVRTIPTRHVGIVPRIIDDETWARIQQRLASAKAAGKCRDGLIRKSADHRAASAGSGRQKQLWLDLRPRSAHTQNTRELIRSHGRHVREFGKALAQSLTAHGIEAGFYAETNVLSLWGVLVHVKLAWPDVDSRWHVRHKIISRKVHHILVVRMQRLYQPFDYFVLTPELFATKFPSVIDSEVPAALERYRSHSPSQLVEKLAKLSSKAMKTQDA